MFLADAGPLGRWNIVFDTQPAQSPGLNLCDFYAIRSEARDEAHLIEIVTQTWKDYDSDTLKRAWGHLHAVYRSLMLAGGPQQLPQAARRREQPPACRRSGLQCCGTYGHVFCMLLRLWMNFLTH